MISSGIAMNSCLYTNVATLIINVIFSPELIYEDFMKGEIQY